MLLYDWKKIFITTQGDPVEITRVLKVMLENKIPRNKYDPIYQYSQLNFKGQSFLVHPELLLYNGYKHSYRDVAVYVAMAALRPLADYHAYGKITLDVLHTPDEILQYIDSNSLLSIDGDDVHFLYEGSPKTTEIH
jgi:hypothetical protein